MFLSLKSNILEITGQRKLKPDEDILVKDV